MKNITPPTLNPLAALFLKITPWSPSRSWFWSSPGFC